MAAVRLKRRGRRVSGGGVFIGAIEPVFLDQVKPVQPRERSRISGVGDERSCRGISPPIHVVQEKAGEESLVDSPAKFVATSVQHKELAVSVSERQIVSVVPDSS